MRILRTLFWLVLFVLFTFSFVVLFEYGTSGFVDGFKTEFHRVTKYVEDTVQPSKKKEQSP